MTMTIDAITKRYVELREQRRAIEAKHKEELVPILRDMELLEAALMKLLQQQGAKSVRTPHGTPYISEVTSLKVEDWEGGVLPYILEHQAWDLLVRNVNKTAVIDGNLDVPGLRRSTTLRLNVRSN